MKGQTSEWDVSPQRKATSSDARCNPLFPPAVLERHRSTSLKAVAPLLRQIFFRAGVSRVGRPVFYLILRRMPAAIVPAVTAATQAPASATATAVASSEEASGGTRLIC